MFILEREEQVDDLLRSWALRLKSRHLHQILIPYSPETFAWLSRLLRYSGSTAQEIWYLTHQGDQILLWIEEPIGTQFLTSPFLSHPESLPLSAKNCWNWSSPCITSNQDWCYPLLMQSEPHSDVLTETRSHPPKQLAFYTDQAGLWKNGDQLIGRFDSPLSLHMHIEHPARTILVRKLLINRFNWSETLLIDLGESPLHLFDAIAFTSLRKNDPTLSDSHYDAIKTICREIQKNTHDKPVVILCDAIATSHEAAIIKHMQQQLQERSPLVISLEPSDHFNFNWTISEKIEDLFLTSKKSALLSKPEMNLLETITRMVQVLPDRLSFEQMKRWFKPSERPQIDACLSLGLLSEKSGAVIINELLPTGSETSDFEELALLKKALQFKSGPFCHLKLLLITQNCQELLSLAKSPVFIKKIHQQSRKFITVACQTEHIWLGNETISETLLHLALSLFLFAQVKEWLDKLTLLPNRSGKVAYYRKVLENMPRFSPSDNPADDESALPPALDAWLNRSKLRSMKTPDNGLHQTLRKGGYLALSLAAQIEQELNDYSSADSQPLAAKMNNLLYQCKCLDIADLMIWAAEAWAQWLLLHGSPLLAKVTLQESLKTEQAHLLNAQPTLAMTETILGHWDQLPRRWPQALPGGFSPPDMHCWDYLHLLLQHRFVQAKDFLTHLSPESWAKTTRNGHPVCAGLEHKTMLIISRHLAAIDKADQEQSWQLPPWLDFILTALKWAASATEPDEQVLKRLSQELLGKERSYFYYEYHYLRFNLKGAPLPQKGNDLDIFLDTCAYFSRRGRELCPNIRKMRSLLAEQTLHNNQASDKILIRQAGSWLFPKDHLMAAQALLNTRFSPDVCFMQLSEGNKVLLQTGSPSAFTHMAEQLLHSSGKQLEEILSNREAGVRIDPAQHPCLISLHTIRLLHFPLRSEACSLKILMGFNRDPQPNCLLNERLCRCLATILELLNRDMAMRDSSPSPLQTIVGESQVISALKKQIRQVSQVDFTVAIYGESGTGKELIAHAIHQLSPRREQPFLAINCASLPDQLLEAELFGSHKGAFTDAKENRLGLIEAAEGGSLFLDEIGEMSLLLQAKMLRFLQDHTLRRLGENQQRLIDCRILCATNRDLSEMVKQGSFREDLYYRIHELQLHSPALRNRLEDMPLLVDHFMKKYQFTAMGQTDMHWLTLKWMDHHWPGNVRELESRIKELITYYPHSGEFTEAPFTETTVQGRLHSARNQFERICISSTLQRHNWHKNLSAESLGISRVALFKLIKKHQIKEPEGA